MNGQIAYVESNTSIIGAAAEALHVNYYLKELDPILSTTGLAPLTTDSIPISTSGIALEVSASSSLERFAVILVY